ncbi:MAG TPA: AraC family transcriptional regulator [Dongiaceae bacterium]|nr:AraC family transcriptional regulator [Dongiaceae bacterium]
MLYLHRRPAPPLDAFVEAIWFCRSEPRPHALERVLPSGSAQLIINLAEDQTRMYDSTARGLVCRIAPGSVLSGVSTRYQIIDTAETQHVAGIVFRPGGTLPFVVPPASELSNLDVPLECICGAATTRKLREQLLAAPRPDAALNLLERWLAAAFRERACHPAVTFALQQFHGEPSVARIAAVKNAIGLSPKRFIERFKAEIGVTPKRYCRLLRFQRAVKIAHAGTPLDWAQLALECGYFDQAHFIHEFREFSGLTPSAYQAATTSFQNHVTFLQSN